LTVTSSTIAFNSAGPGFGGGLFLGAPAAMRDTIVTDNQAQNAANCFNVASSGGHNLESSNTCGLNPALGDLPNTDPMLGPLGNVGGRTPTHFLASGSPAIDAGDPVGCPDRDQRGVHRPLDGTGDGVARCDIGAVEARGPLLVSTGTGPTGGPHVKLFRV